MKIHTSHLLAIISTCQSYQTQRNFISQTFPSLKTCALKCNAIWASLFCCVFLGICILVYLFVCVTLTSGEKLLFVCSSPQNEIIVNKRRKDKKANYLHIFMMYLPFLLFHLHQYNLLFVTNLIHHISKNVIKPI